jgi:hypothetical protein
VSVSFITRDGAEVRVEDGVGRIVELNITPGKRNAQIVIEAQGLREKVTGWVDGTDAELVAQVRSAHASLQLTPYRIEVVRDAKAPKDVSIADLPKRSKFRRVVAIGAAADPWSSAPAADAPQTGAPVQPPPPGPESAPAAATASPRADSGDAPPSDPATRQAAVENMLRVYAEDVIGGREPQEVKAARDMAIDLGATPEDLEAAVETARNRRQLLTEALKALRKMVDDGADRESPAFREQQRLCVDLGASDQQMRWANKLPPRTDPASPDPLARYRDPDRTGERAGAPYDGTVEPAARPSPAAHSGLGHRAAPRGLTDPQPWKRTYEDGPLAGAINPSSYEVGEVVGLVKLAQRLLIRRARVVADETGTAVVAPTVEQVQGLARALVLAADRVQIAVRGPGSSVDRLSGLYRRATSAVWEAIDWYPYPGPEASREDVAGWHAAVVEHALTTIRVAFALLGQALPEPAPPAAAPVAPAEQTPIGEPEAASV